MVCEFFAQPNNAVQFVFGEGSGARIENCDGGGEDALDGGSVELGAHVSGDVQLLRHPEVFASSRVLSCMFYLFPFLCQGKKETLFTRKKSAAAGRQCRIVRVCTKLMRHKR